MPEDDVGRPAATDNLATCLGERFNLTGVQADLDAAIAWTEEAVRLTPERHPDRAIYVGNLGGRLGERFGLTHKASDLDAAMPVQRRLSISTRNIEIAALSQERVLLLRERETLEAEDPAFREDTLDYGRVRELAREGHQAIVYLQPLKEETGELLGIVVHAETPEDGPEPGDILRIGGLHTDAVTGRTGPAGIGRGGRDLHAPNADRDLGADLQELQPDAAAGGLRQLAAGERRSAHTST
jgi:hypothetical protein